MQPNPHARLIRALARQGLDVAWTGHTWSVRLSSAPLTPALPPAEVLLAPGLPVEARAFTQLAQLAAVSHPSGGGVCRACATPDFHPGEGGVAIGSVAELDGVGLPAAIGRDINCGMRLHVVDLPLDTFLSKKAAFIEAMTGDYLLGTRDVTLHRDSLAALFEGGLIGLLDAHARRPAGVLAQADTAQLWAELSRVHFAGSLPGALEEAPEDLRRGEWVRDGGLATIGGGNHFVEIGVVEAVQDRRVAWAWGVREGQISVLIHSGSRAVGKHVGGAWMQRAKAAWPRGVKHPESGLFPLSAAATPELWEGWRRAEATAANYAFANRLFLAELLRARLRALFPAAGGRGEIEAPLVYDLPHNLTFEEEGPAPLGGRTILRTILRKGACPAHPGQPVIIPGSMGAPSYLLVGRGSERSLSSASHGAGRARSRFEMGREGRDPDEDLGLEGVECITLKPERRIEEAPAAYKPITPIIEAQVAAGMVAPVARLRPLFTFKA